MSGCPKCNGSGFVAVCVEPMAGLAGYESWPCGCEPVKRLPMPEPEPYQGCDCTAAGADMCDCWPRHE